MPAPYKKDLCEKVVLARVWDGLSWEQISKELRVNWKTAKSCVERWERGEPLELDCNKGSLHHDRQWSTEYLSLLLEVIKRDETLYLEEIAEALEEETGEEFSLAGICRGLSELNITRKQAGVSGALQAFISEAVFLLLHIRETAASQLQLYEVLLTSAGLCTADLQSSGS